MVILWIILACAALIPILVLSVLVGLPLLIWSVSVSCWGKEYLDACENTTKSKEDNFKLQMIITSHMRGWAIYKWAKRACIISPIVLITVLIVLNNDGRFDLASNYYAWFIISCDSASFAYEYITAYFDNKFHKKDSELIATVDRELTYAQEHKELRRIIDNNRFSFNGFSPEKGRAWFSVFVLLGTTAGIIIGEFSGWPKDYYISVWVFAITGTIMALSGLTDYNGNHPLDFDD